MPEAALIGVHNAWRLRWESPRNSVLVLSYPWLDKEHPGREGEQLAKIVPILEVMLKEAKAARGGGEHATVGVLWDYMCMPQVPRTSEEEAVFKQRLTGMHEWYAHPHTNVLLVTTPTPAGADYGNTRQYHARGWCFVEFRLSGLVKDAGSLWDLSAYKGGGGMGWDEVMRVHNLADMKAGRAPPISPEAAVRELRDGVASGAIAFASPSDMELVLEIYTRGFTAAFETYRASTGKDPASRCTSIIGYEGLGWGKAEVARIVEAIEYAEGHCDAAKVGAKLTLVLSDNEFDSEDKATLEAAVKGSSIFVLDRGPAWKRK